MDKAIVLGKLFNIRLDLEEGLRSVRTLIGVRALKKAINFVQKDIDAVETDKTGKEVNRLMEVLGTGRYGE